MLAGKHGGKQAGKRANIKEGKRSSRQANTLVMQASKRTKAIIQAKRKNYNQKERCFAYMETQRKNIKDRQ